MSEPAGAPILTEQSKDAWNDDYTTEWYVDPPAPGIPYRVMDCTWTADHKTRRIWKIELGQGKSTR